MKNTDDFHYERKPSLLQPNRHFSLSAKMIGHNTSNSMKNALYVLRYDAKGTSRAEVTPNSEKKIKLVALAIIELRLPDGIGQAVSRNSVK